MSRKDAKLTDRIVDEFAANWYTKLQTIDMPFGTLNGRKTPEGSSIDYSDYTLESEGKTYRITGISWGHGILFLDTDQKGVVLAFPYERTKDPEYEEDDLQDRPEEDEDAGCEDCPSTVQEDDGESDSLKALHGEGFRTTRAKALRAVQWFNGGRPRTERCPVSVMRNGSVCDTEMIPSTASGKTFWSEMEMRVVRFNDTAWNEVGGRTAVWLCSSYEVDNGGGSGAVMTHVRSVEIHGDTLAFSGYAFGSEAERSDWREVAVTVGIVEKAEAQGKPAPKWYTDSMNAQITVDDWLEPTGTVPAPSQLSRGTRQHTLEEFA